MEDKMKKIEKLVSELFIRFRAPAHLKGYYCARIGIILVVMDISLLDSITQRLYPEINKNNSFEVVNVGRAIEHFISVIYEKGNLYELEKYFGTRQKPTNAQFIATIADRIRMGISDNLK